MGIKNSDDGNKKPFLYYYIIVLLVVMVLNALVFPSMMERSMEVPFSEFTAQLDAGNIKEAYVSSDNTEIVYSLKPEEGARPQWSAITYKTGNMVTEDELEAKLSAAGVEVYTKQIPHKESPLVNFLMTWIFPILMFVVIGQIMARMMAKRMGGGNAMTFGKSNAKIYGENETGVTFRDVAGEEEAKDALKEIVDFLHNPEKYADIGANLPKGALLVGPPGTGKTLLAKAVAGEAHVPFFSISGSEFVEMFVGMGAAKVRDLFKQANEKAPCIVFIDEIDTIGKKRDGGGMSGNDEREQTLNQLLTEMDGFDGKKGVVILAATNRPESLDPALLRPGRFDRRVPVELPDLKGREAILKVHGQKVKMSDDVDYNAIARATAGASGAELANIVNEAALRAVRFGRKAVCQEDLQESVETVIAGYQKKNAVIPPEERRIVAYHEVGHALVAACQSHSAPVQKITIIPRTSGALGYTMQVDEEEHFLMSREELENKIATFTGGRAAEELVFHSITTGASNDIERATAMARGMVTRYGMSEILGPIQFGEDSNEVFIGRDWGHTRNYGEAVATTIDEEVKRIVMGAYNEAIRILQENMEVLHASAKLLVEKEKVTGDEFRKLFDADVRAEILGLANQTEEPIDAEATETTNETTSAAAEEDTTTQA